MSLEEKIDSLFSDYNKPGIPGASVMVIKDGRIIFRKGYGLADVQKNIPITSETNFRLASVTKQFTAMCILQLVQKGQLGLETSLTEIFPGFPAYGKNIKIRNLLQHTSGLIDYEDLIPGTTTEQVKDNDVLDLILKTDSTYFTPGSKWKYSNTGYALLALTVERISGRPFRDYLNKNIFLPLGMNNTLAYEKGINEIKNRAYGYTIKGDTVEFTDQSITSAVLGDGGIYSSADDLYKWDEALYTGKLIGRKYLEESWTPVITTAGETFPYGYGWHLENYNVNKVVYHTGSTRGFRNIIYRIPEKKFTVIILTNRDGGEETRTLNFARQITGFF